MPEALVGMASAFADSEPEKASGALERAMKTNPNLIDGHLLIAGQDIDSEQYDKAQEEIEKVLAVNPKSAEAISLRASISFLRKNTGASDKYVKQSLVITPQYSQPDDTIDSHSEVLLLYTEAVAFARAGLRLHAREL